MGRWPGVVAGCWRWARAFMHSELYSFVHIDD